MDYIERDTPTMELTFVKFDLCMNKAKGIKLVDYLRKKKLVEYGK